MLKKTVLLVAATLMASSAVAGVYTDEDYRRDVRKEQGVTLGKCLKHKERRDLDSLTYGSMGSKVRYCAAYEVKKGNGVTIRTGDIVTRPDIWTKK